MKDVREKAKRRRSLAAEAGRQDRYVVRQAEGWVVRKAGAARPSGVYRTQAEAEKAAREIVRHKGGEVLIQGRDGRIRESFTVGRDSFARISAVEGIRLSREMREDLREFDRKGLSNEERRRAITRKYGRKPA